MLAPRRPLPPLLLPVLLATFIPRPAHAEPWFGWGDNALEERYLDGDIDVEDLVEGTRVARSRGGSQQLRAGTWLTVGTFVRTVFGKVDVGTMVLVGAAFDRVAEGRVHRLSSLEMETSFADGPKRPGSGGGGGGAVAPTPAPESSSPSPGPPAPAALAITPAVARQAVTAAWKASGIGVDDTRIDSMIARARQSAGLPETRLRVMKVIDDSSQVGVIPTDTSTYDLAGANLYLEARLTWRLDRLLYADDEPTLEKSRLERQDARERISAKVIDSLFQWQRAKIAQRGAIAGTKELIDATLRMAEAEAALDVLTGGWFGGWVARQAE
ncbi:MAG: hypothetical protein ACLQVI_05275 [Polyangiaceae bacterium]